MVSLAFDIHDFYYIKVERGREGERKQTNIATALQVSRRWLNVRLRGNLEVCRGV